jgi:hypothetical protein
VKEKLLAALGAARERETELAALDVDAPADPGGRWSAKDHLLDPIRDRPEVSRLLAT